MIFLIGISSFIVGAVVGMVLMSLCAISKKWSDEDGKI